MNCLAHIVKYILYVFNLIFVICGILLIVLGSVTINKTGDISSFKDVINNININTIPILVIILGCIVFIVAFFGCCGAIRESICCTTVYAVFMLILLVLQITLVIWIFVKRQDFLNTMSDVVDEAWKKNDDANGSPMDALQMAFNCCGVKNSEDYTNIGKPVPSSCCGTLTGSCPESTYSMRTGCRIAFVDFWASNTNIIRYAGIGVALVELVAFIFATCLASNIRRQSSHRM